MQLDNSSKPFQQKSLKVFCYISNCKVILKFLNSYSFYKIRSPSIFLKVATLHYHIGYNYVTRGPRAKPGIVIFELICSYLHKVTDSTKINRPGHNIRMYWMNFRQPTAHVQQNIFGKTLIGVCSPHLYASFDTFCANIDQSFEVQWILEACLKIDNWLSSKENVVDFGIFPNV